MQYYYVPHLRPTDVSVEVHTTFRSNKLNTSAQYTHSHLKSAILYKP